MNISISQIARIYFELNCFIAEYSDNKHENMSEYLLYSSENNIIAFHPIKAIAALLSAAEFFIIAKHQKKPMLISGYANLTLKIAYLFAQKLKIMQLTGRWPGGLLTNANKTLLKSYDNRLLHIYTNEIANNAVLTLADKYVPKKKLTSEQLKIVKMKINEKSKVINATLGTFDLKNDFVSLDISLINPSVVLFVSAVEAESALRECLNHSVQTIAVVNQFANPQEVNYPLFGDPTDETTLNFFFSFLAFIVNGNNMDGSKKIAESQYSTRVEAEYINSDELNFFYI